MVAEVIAVIAGLRPARTCRFEAIFSNVPSIAGNPVKWKVTAIGDVRDLRLLAGQVQLL